MIDSHCHLADDVFETDLDAVVARATEAGLEAAMCILAVGDEQETRRAGNVRAAWPAVRFAVGVHPHQAKECAGQPGRADRLVRDAFASPDVVAVGEIGLDRFVPGLDGERLERFCAAQLGLARQFGLPVILHTRRAVDEVAKLLRRIEVPGGIAHAFNGSRQQADVFLGLGCKLGFGGAMTFERALRIRALAAELPLDAIVLETDAPDIAPQWLYRTAEQRAAGATARNEPSELPRIGGALAALRGIPVDEVEAAAGANARAALPRLG